MANVKKAAPQGKGELKSITVDLNAKALEILEKAQKKGSEHSFMFITLFKRYQEQIAHLQALEDAIRNEGTMVEKEYVKGRANLYVNPAVSAYNQTSTAADKTAQLIMKCIVTPLSDGDEQDEFDIF